MGANMFLSQLSPLFEKLRRQDSAVAIINQQDRYCYGALGKRVAAIAASLSAFQQQNVLIYGHKQIDAVAAILASILSNCCFTFVDEANPPSRVQKIAALTGSVPILNVSEQTLKGIGTGPQIMTTGLPDADTAQLNLPEAFIQPLFYILPTSGSTGEPKGVQIGYDSFAAFNGWFADDVTANAQGCHVNHACLSFDMGILDLIPPLCRGKTVLMLDHKNNMLPRQNIRLMLRHAADCPVSGCFSTPGFLEIMLKDAQFNAGTFPAFTHYFIGGDRVSPGLVSQLQQRFPAMTILHGYGPTETTCLSHLLPIGDAQRYEAGLLPLGETRGLMRMCIIDEQGRPLPAGCKGQVRLYGPQVSAGYLPKDHPRNSAFGHDGLSRYYDTGDKGYINDAGSLYVCGREDGQLKLNGNRIEVAEIEAAACDDQNVLQCCLAVSEKAPTAATLHLFVQLRDDTPASQDAFRRHLAQRLPANMIPRSVIFQQEFPMTLHAKIDKKALLEALEARISAS